MSCFLYILENLKGRRYVGITKLQPIARLVRHNKGDVYATKFDTPWKLVHVEEFPNYQHARKREKQIKSWHGGRALHNLLSRAGGSSNGRTQAFGACYDGSNPSPPARERKMSVV